MWAWHGPTWYVYHTAQSEVWLTGVSSIFSHFGINCNFNIMSNLVVAPRVCSCCTHGRACHNPQHLLKLVGVWYFLPCSASNIPNNTLIAFSLFSSRLRSRSPERSHIIVSDVFKGWDVPSVQHQSDIDKTSRSRSEFCWQYIITVKFLELFACPSVTGL